MLAAQHVECPQDHLCRSFKVKETSAKMVESNHADVHVTFRCKQQEVDGFLYAATVMDSITNVSSHGNPHDPSCRLRLTAAEIMN